MDKYFWIEYAEKKGRFEIECPMYMNELVRTIPNRRFNKSSKLWFAPGIRANVEHLSKMIVEKPTLVRATPKAQAHIKNSMAEYAEKIKERRRQEDRFPVWYPFKTKPRKKQLEGLNKVFGLDTFALFMDMRTGKTKVIIDLFCAYRMQGECERVLIICPMGVRGTWIRELALHAPIPVDAYLLDTSKPKAYERWVNTRHDFKWLIVGVESFSAGSAATYVDSFLTHCINTAALVDESHKIKTPNATRSEKIVEIGHLAKIRGIMTGTPTSGPPLDLYMQFEFLDPEIIGMGDFYSFKNRYAVFGGFQDKQIVGYENLDELMQLIEPFVFQVRQNEVLDIPDKIRLRRDVQLNPEQKRLYQQMKRNKMVQTGDQSLIVQNILEKMLRLQEITSGIISYSYTPEEIEAEVTRKYGPDWREAGIKPKVPKFYREHIAGKNPKVEAVLDAAEEFQGSTIVWCCFVEEIQLIAAALRRVYGDDQVVELHGGIDEKTRDHNVYELFQKGKARFIVSNAATGGVGITMSQADNEFFVSNSFNYIDRKQAEERGTASDQKVGLVLVDIVCEGTVDCDIVDALDEKHDVAEFVRNSIDRFKAEYSGLDS